MSIIKTAVNPLRQSQHKKVFFYFLDKLILFILKLSRFYFLIIKPYLVDNLSTNSQKYNCDTGVSTKSFEQFIKSPSLQLNNQINESKLTSKSTNTVV
jgi:hypothetical protein